MPTQSDKTIQTDRSVTAGYTYVSTQPEKKRFRMNAESRWAMPMSTQSYKTIQTEHSVTVGDALVSAQSDKTIQTERSVTPDGGRRLCVNPVR